MTKVSIARSFRDKYGMEMPSLKLARIMYNANKLTFKNVEDARGAIRRIEGKNGKGNNGYTKITHEMPNRPYNPYSLPASEETIYTPYQIKGHKRVGILSDIHVPYHNISALSAAIEFLKKQKIDGLLLNGDTIDCHRLSRYTKNPKKRNFKLELDTFKELFNVLEKQLKCKIYFKLGNHEIRYQNFLYEVVSIQNG